MIASYRRRARVRPRTFVCIAVGLCVSGSVLSAQPRDPGVRGGPAGAGGPFQNLNDDEKAFFFAAIDRFQEVDSVSGTIEKGVGLGPTFNGNSCAMCHVQPAIGGSSPTVNPQLANNFPHVDGAANPVDLSGFLSLNGPIREVRLVRKPDGSPDGGVHDIFTIAGRTDAPGCTVQNLPQPNFPQEIANHNAVFRIPTPLFGAGLLEAVTDDALVANLRANAAVKEPLGIFGRFNRSSNDGTITRFGWKAQNKSLIIFAGEAYNVEQGVSNEVFPNERATALGCQFNPIPEDSTNLTIAGTPASQASALSSDTVNFAAFMRLSAAPAPTTATASELHGQQLINSIHCTACHTATLTTGSSTCTGMSNLPIHPYTDLALHHMGPGLADGITQGLAGGNEFRTAPLWGLGQRVFFLHDGRASDLLQAILAHSSAGTDCDAVVPSTGATTSVWGSEANRVIERFRALSPSDQQDILNFLRSL